MASACKSLHRISLLINWYVNSAARIMPFLQVLLSFCFLTVSHKIYVSTEKSPSWEDNIFVYPFKLLSAIYGNWSFIIVWTQAHQLTHSWAILIPIFSSLITDIRGSCRKYMLILAEWLRFPEQIISTNKNRGYFRSVCGKIGDCSKLRYLCVSACHVSFYLVQTIAYVNERPRETQYM
jgi:hypothetical protein